jgi:hypothetical protein
MIGHIINLKSPPIHNKSNKSRIKEYSKIVLLKMRSGNIFLLKRYAPIAPIERELAWGNNPTPLYLFTDGNT